MKRKIEITRVEISNFMGIEKLDFPFLPSKRNFVHGANGTGKSSLCSALNWSLHGENLNGKTTFSVANVNSRDTDSITMVRVHLLNGGSNVVLEKTIRNKYKKGTKEVNGRETKYSVNGVDLPASEYKSYIFRIGVESHLVNPLYFANALKAEERRSLLVDLVSGISDVEIFAMDNDITKISSLLSQFTIESLKKTFTSNKKEFTQQLQPLPATIVELQAWAGQPAGGRDSLEKKLAELRSDLTKLQSGQAEVAKLLEKERLFRLDRMKYIDVKDRHVEKLRKEFHECNGNESDSIKDVCELCGQPLKFLLPVNSTNEIFEMTLAGDTDLMAYNALIEHLEQEILTIARKRDTLPENDYGVRACAIMRDIQSVELDLEKLIKNEALQTRINELKSKEAELVGKLNEVDEQLFLVQKYLNLRATLLEKKLNDNFSNFKVKLFDLSLNGEPKEVCDLMIDGVPFSDANNAARVNAGLELIKAFNEKNDVITPLLIDNRESITNLIELENQIINFVVDDNDKTLTLRQS